MLGFIFEKTSALASELYDGTAAVGNYIIEDIQSIPDSLEKGWTDGLFEGTPEEDVKKIEEHDIEDGI